MSIRSSISRVSSRLLLALALCAPACGDDQQQAPDAQVVSDAAAIDAPVIDAMQPDIDAGAPMIDAGAPMIDAGAPMIDAGAPMIDAGAPMIDAGVLDPVAICTTLCTLIGQCFMVPTPKCQSACTADLGDCSQPDLMALDGCAAVGCEDLIACIEAVSCVGNDNGPACGDSVCEPGEDCGNCPQDCGTCVCGDGTCSAGECASCAADCPGGCICLHDECTVGSPLDPPCTQCTTDICAVDPFCCTDTWDSACVSQAESICGKMCPDACGDGFCSPGEDSNTCPQDCGSEACGDGSCDPGEDAMSCPPDCDPGTCGNGACDPWEDSISCPSDCAP